MTKTVAGWTDFSMQVDFLKKRNPKFRALTIQMIGHHDCDWREHISMVVETLKSIRVNKFL